MMPTEKTIAWPSRSVAVLIWASLLYAATPASSRQPTARPANDSRAASLVETWHSDLRKAEVELVAGNAKAAQRHASRVLSEMTERIIEPGGIQSMVALAMTLRALAAVELGDEKEGIWDWQIAQQLFPELAQFDLAVHGESGRLLMAYPPPPPVPTAGPGSRPEDGLTLPRKIREPLPIFPPAKRGASTVRVVVQTVVGVDGVLHSPRIVQSAGEPTLLVLSFDAIRQWRFRPGTRDGEPVEVPFSLVVNFGAH